MVHLMLTLAALYGVIITGMFFAQTWLLLPTMFAGAARVQLPLIIAGAKGAARYLRRRHGFWIGYGIGRRFFDWIKRIPSDATGCLSSDRAIGRRFRLRERFGAVSRDRSLRDRF